MFKLTLLACLVAPLICKAKAGEFHTSQNGDLFYVEKDLNFSWKDALHECTIRNMSLFTPVAEVKELDILKVMAFFDIWTFWTAGVETENLHFMWITTGDNLSYTNWQEGVPKRSSYKAQCIAIHTFQWKSYDCTDLRQFICEENLNITKKNIERDALPEKESETNNQLENSRIPLPNVNRDLNESKKKLECDKHIINELDVLWKSYENKRENHSEDKQREINDLKNKNEQYLNQLSVAKAQLELKSKEIEMVKEFNEIQLRLLEDKYKMYTGLVDGILQVFKQLDKPK